MSHPQAPCIQEPLFRPWRDDSLACLHGAGFATVDGMPCEIHEIFCRGEMPLPVDGRKPICAG